MVRHSLDSYAIVSIGHRNSRWILHFKIWYLQTTVRIRTRAKKNTHANVFLFNRPPIGMALLTICVGLLSILDFDSSFSSKLTLCTINKLFNSSKTIEIYGFTIIGGFALGFVIPAAIIALQASVEPKDIAVVTGLGNFSRILGGALGVAISSAILNTSLAQDLALYVPADIVSKILDSSNYVRNGCPPVYLEIVLKCYVDAIRLIWHVMIGMSGFGFCLSCLIKAHPIRKPKEQTTSAAPESVVIDVESKTEKQDENRQ